MASIIFVQLLIFASCVVKVSSLRCYSCVSEDNPDSLKICQVSAPSALGNNKEVNCSSEEDRCAITKTIQKNGTVTTFNRLCAKSSNCMTKCSSPNAEGTVICGSCCEEDFCNKGEGPKSDVQSGASRITMARGLYMIGGILFCSWLVWEDHDISFNILR